MKKVILLFLASFILNTSFAGSDFYSVCQQDSRVPVANPRVGKIFADSQSEHVCTATLIGPNCAISAGHCSHLLKQVKFGTDVYFVNPLSVKALDEDIGKDWAVFSFKLSTKGQPGKRFGFYNVSFSDPKVGEAVAVAGFGEDERNAGAQNYFLQVASGKVLALEHELFGRTLLHDVDTMGGNSGSAIVRTQDQMIVGIHTHSGCGSNVLLANMGTLLAQNPALQAAIESCKASHKE